MYCFDRRHFFFSGSLLVVIDPVRSIDKFSYTRVLHSDRITGPLAEKMIEERAHDGRRRGAVIVTISISHRRRRVCSAQKYFHDSNIIATVILLKRDCLAIEYSGVFSHFFFFFLKTRRNSTVCT